MGDDAPPMNSTKWDKQKKTIVEELHGVMHKCEQRKRQFYGMILIHRMWIVNVVQGISEMHRSGIWTNRKWVIRNKSQLDLLNELHAATEMFAKMKTQFL